MGNDLGACWRTVSPPNQRSPNCTVITVSITRNHVACFIHLQSQKAEWVDQCFSTWTTFSTVKCCTTRKGSLKRPLGEARAGPGRDIKNFTFLLPKEYRSWVWGFRGVWSSGDASIQRDFQQQDLLQTAVQRMVKMSKVKQRVLVRLSTVPTISTPGRSEIKSRGRSYERGNWATRRREAL